MKLELLGHPKLVMSNGAQDLPLTKPASLLLYLACRADWVTRDELALFFRPDADEKTARHNLRLLLTRARKFEWAFALEQEGDRLRFLINSDVQAFRAALGRADWQTAVQLYKGDFLERAPGLGLVTFENWLEVERSALASSWQEAALKYAAHLSECEKHHDAAQVLAQVLARDPLAEDVLQRYLRSSYLAGNAAAALSAFQTFKEQLENELGLAPLAETETLAATVKRSETLLPLDMPTNVQVPLAVLRPPLMIGRSQEKAILLNPELRLAIISGEAGVGKSRFLNELVPDALWLRCREGLAHVPYFPIIEAVKALKVLPDLGAYQSDLARLIPELAPEPLPPQDNESAKARLLEALARLVELQDSPLILDDLQWADSATLDFFVFMAHRASLKLYATLRSNERSERVNSTLNSLQSVKGFREIKLAPLNQGAIGELLVSLSPETVEARAFSSWLFEKSGGNPFFLLETLRALFEAQVLSEGSSGWYSSLDTVTQGYSDLAIPPGVAALVERRVKGLSEEARRILDIAAVLVDNITPEFSSQLAGLSVWAANDALAELETQGLLSQGRFSHDLAQEALYKALPASKRCFLHGQIAQILDSEATKLNEKSLIVAEHYYEAGQLERTAQLWNEALAYLDSLGREEDIIALGERTAELDTDVPERYQAMVTLADWYRVRGDIDRATQMLELVIAKSDDATVRSSALTHLAYIDLLGSKYSSASQIIERAFAEAASVTDTTTLTNLKMVQADIYRFTGRAKEASEILETIVAELRQDRSDTFDLANMITALASAYNAIGRYEEALAYYQETYDLGVKLNMTYQKVMAAMNIGATLNYLGKPEEALELMLEAVKVDDYPVFSRSLYFLLACAYLNLEQYDKAECCLDKCLEIYGEQDPTARILVTLGHLYERRGKQMEKQMLVERLLRVLKKAESSDLKVTLYLGVKELGTEAQLAKARPYFEEADLSALHAYTKAQLDKVMAES